MACWSVIVVRKPFCMALMFSTSFSVGVAGLFPMLCDVPGNVSFDCLDPLDIKGFHNENATCYNMLRYFYFDCMRGVDLDGLER